MSTTLLEKLKQVRHGSRLSLPKMGIWPEAAHVFEQPEIYALQAAVAAGRPLLLRGEPGCGKSQLARAAAHVLNLAFISEVIDHHGTCRDLHWRFDAVSRLAEAQVLAQQPRQTADVDKPDPLKSIPRDQLEPKRYLSPGPLWWAFAWQRAEQQLNNCTHGMPDKKPYHPEDGWHANQGAVLLIDELDKADPALPNGLLGSLGNGSFAVPYIEEDIVIPKDAAPPLVIITTNEERQLPAAFMRRCFVHHMALPDEEDAEIFDTWLSERGEAHFPAEIGENVRLAVAKQLREDRTTAKANSQIAPGLAEYIDLLRALIQLATEDDQRLELLDKISHYALKKARGA